MLRATLATEHLLRCGAHGAATEHWFTTSGPLHTPLHLALHGTLHAAVLLTAHMPLHLALHLAMHALPGELHHAAIDFLFHAGTELFAKTVLHLGRQHLALTSALTHALALELPCLSRIARATLLLLHVPAVAIAGAIHIPPVVVTPVVASGAFASVVVARGRRGLDAACSLRFGVLSSHVVAVRGALDHAFTVALANGRSRRLLCVSRRCHDAHLNQR